MPHVTLKKILLTSALSLGTLITFAPYATAQKINIDPHAPLAYDDILSNRNPAEYRSKGIRVGSITLFPQIITDLTYSDNIYANDDLKKSDWITTVTPSLVTQYHHRDFDLTTMLSSANGIYKSASSEDFSDNRFMTSLTHGTNLPLSIFTRFRAERLHESRSSSTSVQNTLEPEKFTHYSFQTGGDYDRGIIGVGLSYQWDRYIHGNTTTRTGTAIINNDRNRDIHTITTQATYDLKNGYEFYTKLAINKITYDTRDYNSTSGLYDGQDRNSKGINFLTGTKINLSKLVTADLGIGYLEQSYDSPTNGMDSIDDFNIFANVAWSMTPITTMNLGLERTIEETISSGNLGYTSTQLTAGIDHELQRNIILSLSTGWDKNSYEGSSRDDEVLRFGITGEYKLNRKLALLLQYMYDQRESNIDTFDYQRNLLMLSLRLKM